jgi:hypothetical protein
MSNVSLSTTSNIAKTVGSQGSNPTNHFLCKDSVLPGSGAETKKEMNQPIEKSTDHHRESLLEMNSNGSSNILKRRANAESQINSTADHSQGNVEGFMRLIDNALEMEVPQSWLEAILEAKTKIESSPEYKKRKFQ